MCHFAHFFPDGLQWPATRQGFVSDNSCSLYIVHVVKCFCNGFCGNQNAMIGHDQNFLAAHDVGNPRTYSSSISDMKTQNVFTARIFCVELKAVVG